MIAKSNVAKFIYPYETDSTMFIQHCIDNGIPIPAGKYFISSALTVKSGAFVYGDSLGKTTISMKSHDKFRIAKYVRVES